MPPSEVTFSRAETLSLADFTRPTLIVPRLREHDTAGIISELSRLLQREGSVADVLPFYHAALNQELMANSALESGIAVPHARLSGVKRLQFALGRAPHPVQWGAKGGWPVQLVFLLAVPATDGANYLHLLGTLARLGQHPETLAELRQAREAEAIAGILRRVFIKSGRQVEG